MLDSLERMTRQRFVNPLFYLAGHDLITPSAPAKRQRQQTVRGKPCSTVQEFAATHSPFLRHEYPLIVAKPDDPCSNETVAEPGAMAGLEAFAVIDNPSHHHE